MLSAALSPAACVSQSSFQCSDDSSCINDGEQGTCEPSGFCAFPDESCDSGRRYTNDPENPVGGQCVSAEEPTSSTTSASSGSGPATVSTSDATSSTGSEDSTSSGADDSTTGSSESSSGGVVEGPNIVFVSSAPVLLADIGVDGADDFCNESATLAGLSGTYVAWLATTVTPAVLRLEGARGWQQVDGTPVFDSPSDIIAGQMFHPIRLDEFGNELPIDVSTGARLDGSAGANCSNWGSSLEVHRAGRTGTLADAWTNNRELSCADPSHVYCFGVDRSFPIDVEPQPGRVAFTTAAEVSSGEGIESLDAQCQTEATSAGLRGTFRALVALAGATAVSRFDLEGEPWVNTLGLPLTSSAALVGAAAIDVPPSFDAEGGAIAGDVWVGAPSFSQPSSQNCTDWTTNAFISFGRVALAEDADRWGDAEPRACSGSRHVVCLQQ